MLLRRWGNETLKFDIKEVDEEAKNPTFQALDLRQSEWRDPVCRVYRGGEGSMQID